MLKPFKIKDLSDAGGRTWTGTGLLPKDFKSFASAYSATPAWCVYDINSKLYSKTFGGMLRGMYLKN